MKLPRFRLFQATPPPPPYKTASSRESGTDGDSWQMDMWAGGPDVNPELSGRAKYPVYREMALSDPAVRSVEWMFKLPAREATWNVEPASDDPLDRLTANYVEDNLGLADEPGTMDLTWDESLNQALAVLRWGAMGEELVFSKDLVPWTDADGDVHQLRPLARLAPRNPATVYKINTDPQTGKIKSIEQDLPDAQPIPGDKLVWYVLDKEGANWFGTSALRPMWGAWKLKKAVMIAAGIGWDRFASGTPLVRYPEGEGNRRRADDIGRNYRQNDQGWVSLTSSDEWDFTIINGAGSLADPVPLLRHYDQQIALAGLQSFSQLGVTDTGSRAVGEVLSEPYYRAVAAIADQIASVRERWVVRRIVDVNFGSQVECPRLRVSKIVPQDVVALSLALSNLSNAGFVFTDRDVQEDLRDRLGIAPLPDLDQPTAVKLARVAETLPDNVGVTSLNGPRRLVPEGTTPPFAGP